MISLSTEGEGRWVDNVKSDDVTMLPRGQALTVVLVKDAIGKKLLNIRCSL